MSTALAVVASLGGVLALVGAMVTVVRAIFRQVQATEELTRAVRDLRVSMNRNEERISALGERLARLEGRVVP